MKTKAEQLEELKTTAAIHLKVADKLQQQIEALESSKCKRFKPDLDEEYYVVDGSGYAERVYSCNLIIDKECYDNFNCYETEALVTKASPMMRRNNAIIMACLIVDPDFVPDYLSGNQVHYYFEYKNSVIGCPAKWQWRASFIVDTGPCVSTEEKWEEAVALLKEWGIE